MSSTESITIKIKCGCKNVLFIFLFAFCFFNISCSNSAPKGKQLDISDTTWRTLQGENIQIRLPNYFKNLSRFRIKEDLPFMNINKEALYNFQNTIEVFEGIDSEIDIYVDTTQRYRYISIFNTEKVEFNESDASYFKSQFVEMQKMNKPPNIKLGEIDAKFIRTSDFVFASYTLPEIDIETGYKLNKSIFLVTGHSYNLTVFEISDSELSVGDYLWTTKKGT